MGVKRESKRERRVGERESVGREIKEENVEGECEEREREESEARE